MVDEFIKKGSANVKKEDVAQVIEKEKEIKDKISRIDKKVYEELKEDLHLILNLLKDYWVGRYQVIPWRSIALAVFGLLYLINPIDLIPDLSPIGLIDDAAILGMVIASIKDDLIHYKHWKEQQEKGES